MCMQAEIDKQNVQIDQNRLGYVEKDSSNMYVFDNKKSKWKKHKGLFCLKKKIKD